MAASQTERGRSRQRAGSSETTGYGLVRATTTNSDGQYSLPALPLGAYELAVSAQGFQKYLQKGITLEVSANPQVDITLKLDNTAETVEVRADAQLVETHENAVSTPD